MEINSVLVASMFLLVQSGAFALSSSRGDQTRPRRDAQAPQTRTSWMLNEEDSWNLWWSYSGVSGPSYWGLLNSDWSVCDKGRRQSPIDVQTEALVYDPNLTPLRADNNLISGVLYNDGHSIVFNDSFAASSRYYALERERTTSSMSSSSSAVAAAASGATASTTKGNSHANLTSANEQKTPTTTTTKSRQEHEISRRDSNDLLTLDEHGAEFVIVDSKEGFVVESGAGPQESRASHESPLLMRDLSNNIELSINQGERLDASLNEMQRQLAGSNQDESLDDGDQSGAAPSAPTQASKRVHLTGAGLAYSYRFESLQLRFGSFDQLAGGGGGGGSEHRIDGRPFAAELQLFAYNWQLYKSYEGASMRPHGLVALAILIDTPSSSNESLSDTSRQTINEQLRRLVELAAGSLTHRGSFVALRELNLSALLPDTEQFVTYEGSLTQPGCHESVTWLILNRPLYIPKQSLDKLRSISADEQSAPNPTGTLIAGNTRPTQPINNRPIRTNIRPPSRASSPTNKLPHEVCPRLWTRYEYSRH